MKVVLVMPNGESGTLPAGEVYGDRRAAGESDAGRSS